MGQVTRLHLPLSLLLLCAGCWTSAGEGERLSAEAQARDLRIAQLEEQNRRNREEVAEKVAQLEDVLERATGVLTRTSADVGVQVDELRNQVAVLEGQIAELRHNLEVISSNLATQRAELDQKLLHLKGDSARLDPSQVPSDKEAHFQAAYQAYETGDHDKAIALFREYLTRYPKDPKAGNAQYWIGSAYLQQNKPATALGEYRKVIAEHSNSTAVDVALYGMADSFYRLHACTDAKSAIEALLRRKPRASLADRAKKLRAEVRKAGKSYCSH